MGDDEFLKELAKDGWVATYNPNPQDWVPQGELLILRKEDND